MNDQELTSRRNLFEIDNAKNLTRDQLVATFVPTKLFARLLSRKNHIILGARGSGKTALAKMLSHNHLSHLDCKFAKKVIESKSFVGIYVGTDVEWAGALKNKSQWQTEAEAEADFQWRLNLSTCCAFLTTLESCLQTYVQDEETRARRVRGLIAEIAKSWSVKKFTCSTINQLQNYLEDVGNDKEQQLTRERVLGGLPEDEDPIGIAFDVPLFKPLRWGITLACRKLDFLKDSAWLLCLDEWEFLESFHHRILNTYLRALTGNLFFKITTMPYCHYTLETNARVSLDVGHDFEYVYIEQVSEGGREAYEFANQIFKKRIKPLDVGTNLREWLGESKLLDRKVSDWGPASANMALLRKYASRKTIERAETLSAVSRQKLSNEITRKIHGALLLRDAVSTGLKGLNLYSGASMAIRCADGNPRRLIRILNRFLQETLETGESQGGRISLSPAAQTKLLRGFSGEVLSRVQSAPKVGPELYDLLNLIGKHIYSRLHDRPLTTDQVSSVTVFKKDSQRSWELVKYAIGLGLLFPNVSEINPDQIPETEGVFHLAYVLAPKFLLLPRRGKPITLLAILANVPDYQMPLELQGKEEE